MTKEELAVKIANALFISSWGGRAVRLQRKLPPKDWNGKLGYDTKLEGDGGGWCYEAAVKTILDVLKEEP